jgi:hypothetical protein
MEVDNTNLTNPLAKRGLDFDEKYAVDSHETCEINGTNGMDVLETAEGKSLAKATAGEKEKDMKKRPKKDGADSPSLGSAGLFDGSVRSQ